MTRRGFLGWLAGLFAFLSSPWARAGQRVVVTFPMHVEGMEHLEGRIIYRNWQGES